jgi:hypothetical protein
MGFKSNGFDELNKAINQVKKDADDLVQTKHVSFDELFPEKFMNQYTEFTSFDNFLEAGNFIVNSDEDFEAIPEVELDKHILSTTIFSSWEDMLSKATEIYALNKLGF